MGLALHVTRAWLNRLGISIRHRVTVRGGCRHQLATRAGAKVRAEISAKVRAKGKAKVGVRYSVKAGNLKRVRAHGRARVSVSVRVRVM